MTTINSLIQKWKVDILCLQETKIEDWNIRMIRHLWGNRWVDWDERKVSGTRGVIVMIWDKRLWKKVDAHQGLYSMSCVYGPYSNPDREVMWSKIAGARGSWDEYWVLGDNFNICRFESERLNCIRRSGAMRIFSEVIQDLDVIALPMQWDHSTWSRGENCLQASRIDRFLICPEWNNSSRAVRQIVLPKGYTFTGSAYFILLQKLKSLKKDITTWNKEEFGKIETRKTKALDELMAFEQAIERRMLDKAKKMQWINVFNVGRSNSVNISHFLYTDDTLIFCGADRNQIARDPDSTILQCREGTLGTYYVEGTCKIGNLKS
ncbi:uncharacterized protein LOC142177990 [Nicotiana tabacum]|uniref:Uncharacterized protein LOC142177990 n=1 Tax=Nicotiana tabacum TaxID=4097 RepID=A0AC58U1Q7_TOBAC